MIFNELKQFLNNPHHEKGCILAIDYGKKKLGIAISDDKRIFAVPVTTIYAEKMPLQVDSIIKLKTHYNFTSIVLGIPLNLIDEETAQSKIVRNFAHELDKKINLPIVLYDEKFTSKIANNILKAQGVKRRIRNEEDDKIAASVLLQSLLDQIKYSETPLNNTTN